ncbi:hypothetical protein D3C87_1958660 [compost metagenome]
MANLNVQPSYGLWARHVKDLTVTASSFNYEQPDGRYVIFLDDVLGAKISDVKFAGEADNKNFMGSKNASDIRLDK